MRRELTDCSRRDFLTQAAATRGLLRWSGTIAGTTGVRGASRDRKIRLVRTARSASRPSTLPKTCCDAEGFTEVEYPEVAYTGSDELTAGHSDLTMDYVPRPDLVLDAGQRIVALSGVHGGCYAIVANERVRAIQELKGKKVAVSAIGSEDHVFLSSMLAYVGVDPRKEIHWVLTQSVANNMRFFVEGSVDAFLAFPPQPQKLREMKLGHVIVNGTQDRPWSQYSCCMIAGTRSFVEKYPVATKRALRALLKAADLCAQEPERAARYIVAKGYEPRYRHCARSGQGSSYRRLAHLNPEDALRFHALRLHEVGHDQVQPAEAHRPRHRLAIPERTEERIEGVNTHDGG